MFKNLRNKFILTNMITATIIILIAFSSIFIATAASHRTPVDMRRDSSLSDEMHDRFAEEIQNDRERRLANLGITLITVGMIIELLVFGISYYLADKASRPVQDAYRKQKEFIANASHELKTPIAAARANFEALGATEQPWTDNVDAELDRAAELVNNMLTLARTDGRVATAKRKEIDLVKTVKKRAQLINARLGEKELKVVAPEEAKKVIAEADLLQILDILFDNAVKYSKSVILIEVTDKSIVVSNDGKVLSSRDYDRIFDRFYQVDKTAEGSGLGLAIAKTVADQNGWKLKAGSNKKMTVFTLCF